MTRGHEPRKDFIYKGEGLKANFPCILYGKNLIFIAIYGGLRDQFGDWERSGSGGGVVKRGRGQKGAGQK
jgi:hypothetical protein